MKNISYLCVHFSEAHVVKLVDTLLSGGSASRRVGSSPIMRTKTGLTFSVNPVFVHRAFLFQPFYIYDYTAQGLYNKTENPFTTADFTNGIFTQTETYKSFGAQR